MGPILCELRFASSKPERFNLAVYSGLNGADGVRFCMKLASGFLPLASGLLLTLLADLPSPRADVVGDVLRDLFFDKWLRLVCDRRP